MVSKIPLKAPALAVDVASFPGDCVPPNVDAGDTVVVCWAEFDPPPPQANEPSAQRTIKPSNVYFISEIPLYAIMICYPVYVMPDPLSGPDEEDGPSGHSVTKLAEGVGFEPTRGLHL
jgi:hypothetical protein